MLYSGKQVVHSGVRERDFSSLMELYELNYMQLRRLVPDVNQLREHEISSVIGGLDLILTLCERSKYTTTLHLTYHLSDDDTVDVAPDLVVRLCHDSQTAEVLSRGSRKGRENRDFDRVRSSHYTVSDRWKVNRFLQKWLGYCLLQGHRFPPVHSKTPETPDSVEINSEFIAES